ncbi:hypothetical protein [Arenibaculum pallidiluteum]|uniref:hypothetical protein n=1 Tax=Arenibaculum pallidiluteum TaxID=2812559 RepID=UPI001A96CC18|nr:hypothetical protein [Arenibaculum pallidiluteum]
MGLLKGRPREGLLGIPRAAVLGGQPHMLAYVNADEIALLQANRGGAPAWAGPGGVPAFGYGSDSPGGSDEGVGGSFGGGDSGDGTAGGHGEPAGYDGLAAAVGQAVHDAVGMGHTGPVPGMDVGSVLGASLDAGLGQDLTGMVAESGSGYGRSMLDLSPTVLDTPLGRITAQDIALAPMSAFIGMPATAAHAAAYGLGSLASAITGQPMGVDTGYAGLGMPGASGASGASEHGAEGRSAAGVAAAAQPGRIRLAGRDVPVPPAGVTAGAAAGGGLLLAGRRIRSR